MTTIDAHAVAESGTPSKLAAAVSEWLTTTDHKRVGRQYVVVALLFALAGAAMGALVGLEGAGSGDLLKGAADQVLSLYRVGLTFLVAVPLVVGVATAVVPLQVGSRAIAFPRLSATGFWMWAAGSVLLLIAHLMNGGLGGGDLHGVELFLTAHILLVLGLLASVVSVVTTILTSRAAGMNLRRVPPFTWSVLVGGVGLLLTLPVLQAATLFNYLNLRYGGAGFGSNKDVVTWLDFAFTQPMTFVYAIPAVGFLAETVATVTRRRLQMRGVLWAGVGLVGVAALAGITQNQSGLSDGIFEGSLGEFVEELFPFALFNLVPVLGAFVAFALCGLVLRNKPTITAPFLFAFFGFGMVFVGMLVNVLVKVDDVGLGGSRAEEGAWIYVVYGIVLFALGALLYWGPKLWGGVAPTKKSAPLALLGVGGTVLASLPLVAAGFADDSDFDKIASVLAAIGHGMVALTVVAVAGLVFAASRSTEPAADDPWDGQTLEWMVSSPAQADNFDHVRTVTSAEPLLDMKPQTDGSAS
jgi:heme/copper-type cytochrome/quinol oxidase subunit 1